MWLFNNFITHLVTIIIILIAPSCGFKTLYSGTKNLKFLENTITVEQIPGKEGFHLREELVRRFGDSNQNEYILRVKVNIEKTSQVVTKNNEITRYKLIMTAIYLLRNLNGVIKIPEQTAITRTNYSSESNSTGYAAQIAEEAARKRLSLKLAEQISTRLLVLSEKWIK